MTYSTVTLERVSRERNSDGLHSYIVKTGSAIERYHVNHIPDVVDGRDKLDAERKWLGQTITALREGIATLQAKIIGREELSVVGQALRNGGYAAIPGYPPVRPYIDAAESLGYVARSNEVDGIKYLLVATDERGLRKLQSVTDALRRQN